MIAKYSRHTATFTLILMIGMISPIQPIDINQDNLNKAREMGTDFLNQIPAEMKADLLSRVPSTDKTRGYANKFMSALDTFDKFKNPTAPQAENEPLPESTPTERSGFLPLSGGNQEMSPIEQIQSSELAAMAAEVAETSKIAQIKKNAALEADKFASETKHKFFNAINALRDQLQRAQDYAQTKMGY